jgi:hypothetical protein
MVFYKFISTTHSNFTVIIRRDKQYIFTSTIVQKISVLPSSSLPLYEEWENRELKKKSKKEVKCKRYFYLFIQINLLYLLIFIK